MPPSRDLTRAGDPLGAELALVAAGGASGTVARHALGEALPAAGGLSVAVALANLLGALALGILVGVLTVRGDDAGPRRRLRLLLGTGVLGGFTTYSAFAVDVVALADRPLLALGYAGGSLLLGVLAAACGLALGRGLGPAPAHDPSRASS